jgi:hypothetical protein
MAVTPLHDWDRVFPVLRIRRAEREKVPVVRRLTSKKLTLNDPADHPRYDSSSFFPGFAVMGKGGEGKPRKRQER